MLLASFPPPPAQVLHLGPVTVRLYALCIIAGVIAAVVVTERRWVARGGVAGTPSDIAAWAVPAGLVGARLYHVITDPELYFGAGRHPLHAFYIWEGGLGIWGAIAGGALAAWAVARRLGVRYAAFADAAAPGIILAQAVGRWGNYFNQELFGGPTSLPWALHVTHPEGDAPPGYYHPTFLYESLWDLGVMGLVLWADRRFRLGHGRAFALYVAGYTAGRSWVEALRVDHANHLLGLRLNEWVSIGVFLLAVAYLVLTHGRGREVVVQVGGRQEMDPESREPDGEDRAEAPA